MPLYTPVSDASLVLTDVTTNNASTTKHGFLKKLSNTATEFMNGAGNWATPSGGSYSQIGTYTVSGTPATISFTGLASEDIIIVVNGLTNNTGNETLLMAASVDNGSNYGTARSIAASPTSATTAHYAEIFLTGCKIGWVRTIGPGTTVSTTAPGITSGDSVTAPTSASFALGAAMNALQLTSGAGALFNAGTVTLYGR